MIVFFSGTGNSRYVAELIGKAIDDNLVSINQIIKTGNREVLKSEKSLVFVCPVYALKIPRIVDSFIREAHFEGNRKAYFVLTCESSSGNALHYIRKICHEKGFAFMGMTSVCMPQNCVTHYDVPDKAQQKAIIRKAVPNILAVAERIKNDQPLSEETVKSSDKLWTGVASTLFYAFIATAKGYYSTDDCVGCGKCAALCPLNNIEIKNHKPMWKSNCTQCMACISGCPKEAIEYRNRTKGKLRYYNTEEPPI